MFKKGKASENLWKAGGGMVEISINGNSEVVDLKIDVDKAVQADGWKVLDKKSARRKSARGWRWQIVRK